jgi:hypothetical protein
MAFLHMHDGEAIIYNDKCPVCVVEQREKLLDTQNYEGVEDGE